MNNFILIWQVQTLKSFSKVRVWKKCIKNAKKTLGSVEILPNYAGLCCVENVIQSVLGYNGACLYFLAYELCELQLGPKDKHLIFAWSKNFVNFSVNSSSKTLKY